MDLLDRSILRYPRCPAAPTISIWIWTKQDGLRVREFGPRVPGRGTRPGTLRFVNHGPIFLRPGAAVGYENSRGTKRHVSCLSSWLLVRVARPPTIGGIWMRTVSLGSGPRLSVESSRTERTSPRHPASSASRFLQRIEFSWSVRKTRRCERGEQKQRAGVCTVFSRQR